MSDRFNQDARHIKKLMREAEAISDEAMVAFSRLKQAMLTARQNPILGVDAGQRAFMRLHQAETQALAMSTSLLRVHDELSKVASTTAGSDENFPTIIQPSAIAQEPEEARILVE